MCNGKFVYIFCLFLYYSNKFMCAISVPNLKDGNVPKFHVRTVPNFEVGNVPNLKLRNVPNLKLRNCHTFALLGQLYKTQDEDFHIIVYFDNMFG